MSETTTTNTRLTAVQIAEILGVTRQAIYLAGRANWTLDDIRNHLAEERREMEARHRAILTRIIDYEVVQ